VSVLRVVAAMTFAVALFLCHAPARAETASPDTPNFLLFTGTDLWRYSVFFYGGTLWSPAGLDRGGFTLKALLNGGAYFYDSGTLHSTIDGTLISGAVMPGWRIVREALTVSVFAGAVVQDYRLRPADPGSHLHGLYEGGQFAGEVWYQPSQNTMAAVNGSIASIGPTGIMRAAFGIRAFDALFIGPETAALWCGDFQQYEFGAHITGFRFNALEWSAGGGWAMDSDRRTGPYLRLGVSVKY
jgi:hypothetical protein